MWEEKLDYYCSKLTNRNLILSILISSIMLLVFVIDLQYTTEVYIGVLYIIVIMLSLSLPNTKYTFVFASISTIFTCFGFFNSIYKISAASYFHATNLINLGMTICAIWITTLIAIYIKNISIALTKSEAMHSAILNTSIDPLIIIDRNGYIESSSKSLEKFFGWSPTDIVGKKFIDLLAGGFKDQYEKLFSPNYDYKNSSLIGSTHEGLGLHRMRRDFPCEVSINYIDQPEIEQPFFSAVLRDISVRKIYEAKMEWLLSHDELTKTYNRHYFNEQIDKEWKRGIRTHSPISLIIMDVDYFKNYNDMFGHQVGDNCLRMIGAALNHVGQRSTDIIARYGGEEFIALLPNTPIEGAIQVASRIHTVIDKLNIAHPHSSIAKKITVSMGVATIVPSLGCSYERLIRFADQALYEAKNAGRNKFHIHQD